jgi:hypothetical protein
MARWTIEVSTWGRTCLIMAIFAAGACPLRAEPHLALRTGHQCQACHVNQTGGGKRNAFGVYYEQEMLPDLVLPGMEPPNLFDGRLHDRFLVGADLRMVNLTRTSTDGTDNGFETQEGNLYLDLILGPGPLRLYSDLRLVPGGAQARELFAMMGQLPGQLYVKAGRFFPPYGWRLHDDESFIRRETGFSFLNADQGVEVGWQPGPLSATLAITNGNGGAGDDNTNKQVSFVGNWVTPRFQLGASGASNRQGDSRLMLGGLMAGWKLHRRFGLLAEVDAGRRDDDAAGTTERLLLAWAEGSLWLTDGLTLRAAFDYSDPDRSRSGDEANRVGAGAEWFALPSVKLRLHWSRTDRPPEVGGVAFHDERQLLLELHMFL